MRIKFLEDVVICDKEYYKGMQYGPEQIAEDELPKLAKERKIKFIVSDSEVLDVVNETTEKEPEIDTEQEAAIEIKNNTYVKHEVVKVTKKK